MRKAQWSSLLAVISIDPENAEASPLDAPSAGWRAAA